MSSSDAETRKGIMRDYKKRKCSEVQHENWRDRTEPKQSRGK